MALPPVLETICFIFEREVQRNEMAYRVPGGPVRIWSDFHSIGKVGSVGNIRSYVERIFFCLPDCALSCYVAAYVYIAWFLDKNPRVRMDSLSVHHLLITAIGISVKYTENRSKQYRNPLFAKIGMLDLKEINHLELLFLETLGYGLHITREEYIDWCIFLRHEPDPEECDALRTQVPPASPPSIGKPEFPLLPKEFGRCSSNGNDDKPLAPVQKSNGSSTSDEFTEEEIGVYQVMQLLASDEESPRAGSLLAERLLS